MKLKHSYTFRNIFIFILITALCLCVMCSSYERTGSFLCDFSDITTASMDLEEMHSVTSDSVFSTSVMTASAPLRFNFAAEETLSSTASSYSSISMFNRTGTNQNRGLFFIYFIFTTLLFVFFHNREVSFCSTCHKNELSSLCITRYIESSDGKK